MKINLAALLLCATAFGQSPAAAPDTADREYSTSCSTFETKAACKSYNELVSAKDSELLTLLKMHNTYVCFREDEDLFNVIALDTPAPGRFTKVSAKSALYQAGETSVILFERFKKGQSDDNQLIFGKWTKLGEDALPYFSTPANQSPSLNVSDSEITYFEEFKNVGGGSTKYTFQIRRSTMRASEIFQWQTPPKDAKSNPNRGDNEFEGHCITFN